MKPTTNRLLVRVEEKKKPKKGKEMEAATSVMTAEVVSHGPLCKVMRKGNKVVFAPYGIDEVTVNDEKLVVIEESLVLLYE